MKALKLINRKSIFGFVRSKSGLHRFVLFALIITVLPLHANAEGSLIFLVRHAEKTDSSADPDLSQAGLQRASALVLALQRYPLARVYSTEFKRTRQTAAAVARSRDLAIAYYSPSKLSDFAHFLQTQSGNTLVVGHSNTTPELVELLGGDPVSKMDEKNEFDRLYVVQINDDGSVSSSLLRYGAN